MAVIKCDQMTKHRSCLFLLIAEFHFGSWKVPKKQFPFEAHCFTGLCSSVPAKAAVGRKVPSYQPWVLCHRASRNGGCMNVWRSTTLAINPKPGLSEKEQEKGKKSTNLFCA